MADEFILPEISGAFDAVTMDAMRLARIKAYEKILFDAICQSFSACNGPEKSGCACTGNCLGAKLAALRGLSDVALGLDGETWISDQAHGPLVKRPHDSGHPGAPLTAENYYPDFGARD